MSKEDKKKLAVLERKFLLHTFEPKKTDQTGEYEIRVRKMNWLGHVWRSNDITRDTLNWKPEGKRSLGRPKKRWIDELNQNFQILGVNNPEEIVTNREEWRKCGAVINGL